MVVLGPIGPGWGVDTSGLCSGLSWPSGGSGTVGGWACGTGGGGSGSLRKVGITMVFSY